MPLIDNNKELLAAIIMQNLLHPKNHQRREAVSGKSYSLLSNAKEAQAYLAKLLANNLKNELFGKESQIRQ